MPSIATWQRNFTLALQSGVMARHDARVWQTTCCQNVSMSLSSIAEQLLKGVASQARSFERGLQRVVEVISPGPLGTKAESWDAQRRHRAAQAVRAAVQRWESQQKLNRGKKG